MLSQHISIYVSVSKQTIATYMLLPVMMVVLSTLKLQELEKLLHDSYVKYIRTTYVTWSCYIYQSLIIANNLIVQTFVFILECSENSLGTAVILPLVCIGDLQPFQG